MTAGLPVVATECGECDTVVTHGETGFLFDPENAALLAEYALILLRDKHRAHAIGAAGRRRVLEKFPLHTHAPAPAFAPDREVAAVAVP